MATNNNEALVKRLFSEGYTQGKNPAVFNEVIADTVKFYDSSAANSTTGLESYKKRQSQYVTAFPDKVATIDQIITSGNDVIVRWTVKGTHKGSLVGIAPTGNKINISGITILTFSGGKVSQIFQSWDRLGLLEQLGQTQLATTLK